jgi:hypothetical protein
VRRGRPRCRGIPCPACREEYECNDGVVLSHCGHSLYLLVEVGGPDVDDGYGLLKESANIAFSVLLLAILCLLVALAVSFIPHRNLLTL